MRIMLITVALISLILGIIGIFLPVLPTTPFILLSAYLFNKTSPRLHSVLTSNPYFGRVIIEWEQGGVIRPKAKAMASFLIITSIASAIYFKPAMVLWVKLIMLLVGASVIVFILTRPSSPKK